MSLNWNAKDCKGSEQLSQLSSTIAALKATHVTAIEAKMIRDAEDKIANLITVRDAVIYSLLFCAVNAITETNFEMVCARVEFRERLFGPLLRDEFTLDRFLTRDDLAPWIGLTTNVTTERGSTWAARMLKNFEEQKQADRRARERQTAQANGLADFSKATGITRAAQTFDAKNGGN